MRVCTRRPSAKIGAAGFAGLRLRILGFTLIKTSFQEALMPKRKHLLPLLMLTAFLGLSACATVQGVGDDLSAAGRTVKKIGGG